MPTRDCLNKGELLSSKPTINNGMSKGDKIKIPNKEKEKSSKRVIYF